MRPYLTSIGISEPPGIRRCFTIPGWTGVAAGGSQGGALRQVVVREGVVLVPKTFLPQIIRDATVKLLAMFEVVPGKPVGENSAPQFDRICEAFASFIPRGSDAWPEFMQKVFDSSEVTHLPE